jgi:hypothetical protein
VKTWPFWIIGTLAAAGAIHLASILALSYIAGGQ